MIFFLLAHFDPYLELRVYPEANPFEVLLAYRRHPTSHIRERALRMILDPVQQTEVFFEELDGEHQKLLEKMLFRFFIKLKFEPMHRALVLTLKDFYKPFHPDEAHFKAVEQMVFRVFCERLLPITLLAIPHLGHGHKEIRTFYQWTIRGVNRYFQGSILFTALRYAPLEDLMRIYLKKLIRAYDEDIFFGPPDRKVTLERYPKSHEVLIKSGTDIISTVERVMVGIQESRLRQKMPVREVNDLVNLLGTDWKFVIEDFFDRGKLARNVFRMLYFLEARYPIERLRENPLLLKRSEEVRFSCENLFTNKM